MIVCIHCPFEGKIGVCITSLTRIAVPIFFMITGFFYPNTVAKNKEKKQLVKILRLTILANGIYILWNVLIDIISGDSMAMYFKETITLKSLGKWIVLNETPFGGYLWYLSAILYLFLAFVISNRITNKPMIKRMMYVITLILLCKQPFPESSCSGTAAATFHFHTILNCTDYVPEVWDGASACMPGKRLVPDGACTAEKRYGTLDHPVQTGMAGAGILENP